MIRAFAIVCLVPALAFASDIGSQSPGGDIGGGGYVSSSGVPLGDIDMQSFSLVDTTQVLQLGDSCATTHSLGATDAIFCADLEVNGSAYLDGALFLSLSLGIMFGPTTSQYGQLRHVNSQTPDSLVLGLGTLSKSLLVTEVSDMDVDFGFAAQTNPTVAVFSADHTSTTDYLAIKHDQTNGVVATGAGALDLSPATGGLIIGRIIAASVAEPATCDVAAEGMVVYVNDNDDSAGSQICICATITDDATYDWRDLGDVAGTACSFF